MARADEIIEHAGEFLRRISPEGRQMARRRRERRRQAFLRVARRMIAAALLIVVAAVAAGLVIGPIGIEGLMAAGIALALAWAAILYAARMPEPTPERMATTDLAQLPAQTERWLEKERLALPAPAQRHIDAITLKLEALSPQLATLDPQEPAAIEVRRLIGDELPELVRGYSRVPASLRRQPLHGGPSPDRQLVEGLAVVDEQIARMNAQLAAGDLHALATQQRFLEIKYRGDEGIG